jgi:hypothetical protein
MTVTVRYLGEARKGIGKKTPDPPLELGFADLVAQELVRKTHQQRASLNA